uniref:Uncharacterized protein n=1 Tax=Oryza glaberrima TaxID=4538 RepID=I1QXV4_ORYGL
MGESKGGAWGRDEPLSGDLISELRLSSSLPSRDPFGPDRCHLFTAGLLLSRLVLPSLLHTRQMGGKRGGRMARSTSSRRGTGTQGAQADGTTDEVEVGREEVAGEVPGL